jgi:voltage-gated potassium channel Kch
VLHSVGAERAACAVITLDTPGANYRSVWAMQKHYPSVKTYVRAHDINHGLNLEKAGATVVVPEILEPSMQLAASVLSQFKLPPEEINTHLNNFRKKHLSELQALAALSGVRGIAARQTVSVVVGHCEC